MRGRTNITQRSGTVPVNGDIKEFTVADGEKINIGDFVTSIYGPSTYLDLPSNFRFDYGSDMFSIGNNKVVAFYGKNICILDTQNGIVVEKVIGGEFHSVGGSYDYSSVFKMDNSHFVIAYKKTSSAKELYFDIITLDIENNTATFETKNYVTNLSLYPRYSRCVVNNNFIFVPFSGTISSTFHSYLVWFDLGSNDFGFCEIIQGENYYSIYNEDCQIVFGDNNEIYIFTNGYKSNYSNYVDVVKFTFNYVEKELVLNGMYNILTNRAHYYFVHGSVCYIGNNNFAVSTLSKTIEIVKVNDSISLLNSISLKNYDSLLFSFKDKLVILQNDSSSYLVNLVYVIDKNDLIGVTEISFNTFNFVKIYFIKSSSGTLRFSYFGFVELEDSIVMFGLSNGSNSATYRCCKCIVDGNNLSGFDSINYVKSYNGNSLGFAKTSGTSGETIQVYVPKSN